jgi:hypothetical protein
MELAVALLSAYYLEIHISGKRALLCLLHKVAGTQTDMPTLVPKKPRSLSVMLEACKVSAFYAFFP